MTATALQTAIDSANRRHKAANSRWFLQKASATQVLEHLEKASSVLADSLRADIRKDGQVSNNSRAALRELDGFLSLVGKHLEQSGAGSGR